MCGAAGETMAPCRALESGTRKWECPGFQCWTLQPPEQGLSKDPSSQSVQKVEGRDSYDDGDDDNNKMMEDLLRARHRIQSFAGISGNPHCNPG